jgi:O-antigen/teichoic acid export membrane protein
MTRSPSAVARHASAVAWLGISEGATPAAGLAIQIILARSLPTERYGEFSALYALFVLLTSVAGLGLLESLVRDGARDPGRLPEILSDHFSLRLAAAAAALLAAAVLAALDPRNAVAAAGVAAFVALRSLTRFLAAAYRAVEAFSRETVLRVGDAGAAVGAAGVGGLLRADLAGFSALLALAAGGFLAAAAARLKRSMPGFSVRAARPRPGRLLAAVPLGLPPILGVLLLRTDVLLLHRAGAAGARAAAYFASAANLALAASLIPALVSAAVFPALSRRHRDLPARRGELLLALAVFLALGLALATCAVAEARPIMRLAYGPAYAPAAPILWALAPLVALLCPTIFAATVLASRGRAGAIVAAAAVAFVGNLLGAWRVSSSGGPLWVALVSDASQAVGAAIAIGFLLFDVLRERNKVNLSQ